MKGGESCPDRGGGIPPVRARKLRPRGQKSPQWSAERRASVTTEATRLARRVGRLRQRRQCAPARHGKTRLEPGIIS
jgi:hypothetical protein